MALRRTLSKRLFRATNRDSSSAIIVTFEYAPISPLSKAAKLHFRLKFFTSPDSASPGFFQHRAINNHSTSIPLPSFLTHSVRENLREKIKSLNAFGNHPLRLEGLSPPLQSPPYVAEEPFGVSVDDAKKVLRFVQLEKVRESVRNIPASTIQYGEFVRICSDVCGNRDEGLEFAKALDQSADVIVLGGVVFLRPDQVAKSMEKLISESIAMPNDTRREELAHLENKKALIDQKAQFRVRGELYCGLGFLVLQTLGFMRLTFWELSWDVMEPICFFVTSFHCLLAYAFFLRTSKEPSFEGYFQRRFKVKQRRLMKAYDFDFERYNELCEVFSPSIVRKKMVRF